ncbi:cupin domain-containing protein [Malonomonas rubra]|uniref:cupin domain-containing protein n=1 Tax=Malonomonas rubra TaxID=57040 RepID=UPI0026F00033|nr:cupin domain-containing protein [Malonomonas rubra]
MATEIWNYQDKIEFSKEKANKVQLGETANSRSTLWCLLPGQHIHPHVHAGDHIWVVLEGEGEFLQEGLEPTSISAGAVLLAPAGDSHGVNNSGSQGLVFVSISAG